MAARPLERFKPSELATAAWAFAAADEARAAVCDERFVRHLERCDWGTGAPQGGAELGMLHQYDLWAQERAAAAPPDAPPPPQLAPPLAERARAAFVAAAAGDGRAPRRHGAPVQSQSTLQREVCAAAAQLGVAWEAEHLTPQGYYLDLVLHVRGEPVGVEVEGPQDFVGRSREPNGRTRLKRRQLQAAGWRLMSVPFYEWDACGQSLAEQREYLSARLDGLREQ